MKSIPYPTLILATAFLLTGNAALAHDDHSLDKMKAPNQGQLRSAGPFHLELLIEKNNTEPKESPVTVFMTDHADKKVSSAGVSGVASILSGKSKVSVPLSPAGDNKLTGTGKYVSDPNMKVVVSLTFPDKKTEQARFTPLSTHHRSAPHPH